MRGGWNEWGSSGTGTPSIFDSKVETITAGGIPGVIEEVAGVEISIRFLSDDWFLECCLEW